VSYLAARKIRSDAKVGTVEKKYGIPIPGIRSDATVKTARKKFKKSK
jgi:hypothetical protein